MARSITILQVVSNFGDSDPRAGKKKHARARNSGETRREKSAKNEGSAENYFWRSPGVALRLPGISRARVCIFARPTIAIAKIGDYSQSKLLLN